MADQQQGSFVLVQHFLQQVQGIHVEIVGGLVQDQEIAGLGQQFGQQQAVAFAVTPTNTITPTKTVTPTNTPTPTYTPTNTPTTTPTPTMTPS
ncbi:MAG: hypothetical protein ABT940_11655, partial [Alphaproteobacteria bacterium]